MARKQKGKRIKRYIKVPDKNLNKKSFIMW